MSKTSTDTVEALLDHPESREGSEMLIKHNKFPEYLTASGFPLQKFSTVLNLNGKLVLIRGENVLNDNPRRYYVHVDGTMFPRVFSTYHSARIFSGKIAKVFRAVG